MKLAFQVSIVSCVDPGLYNGTYVVMVLDVCVIIALLHCTEHQADAVPLHFTCNQIWDDKTGNFTYKVDWSVPDDENVMRAIGSFEVIVDLVGPEDSSERIQNTSFHFDVSSKI